MADLEANNLPGPPEPLSPRTHHPSNAVHALVEQAGKWIFSISLVARSLVALSIFGCTVVPIFGYLFGINFPLSVATNPVLVIEHFNFHRLFISWLFPKSIVSGIFQIFAIYPIVNALELTNGTVFVMVLPFVLNFFIQVVFSASCWIFGQLIYVVLLQTSVGLWSIFFSLLPVKFCSNEPKRLWIIPLSIPETTYPFVMCFVFQFFQIQVDVIVAVIIGHLYVHNVVDSPYALTKDHIVWLERTFIFQFLSQFSGFVSANRSAGSYQPAAHRPSAAEFVPFSGEGYRIGDDTSSLASETSANRETTNMNGTTNPSANSYLSRRRSPESPPAAGGVYSSSGANTSVQMVGDVEVEVPDLVLDVENSAKLNEIDTRLSGTATSNTDLVARAEEELRALDEELSGQLSLDDELNEDELENYASDHSASQVNGERAMDVNNNGADLI